MIHELNYTLKRDSFNKNNLVSVVQVQKRNPMFVSLLVHINVIKILLTF